LNLIDVVSGCDVHESRRPGLKGSWERGAVRAHAESHHPAIPMANAPER